MATRTLLKTVTFHSPFTLNPDIGPLPAGTYRVETDEEQLEGLSFTAFRRISTLISLQADGDRPGSKSVITVQPEEFDAALRRDRPAAGSPDGQ